MTDNTGEHKDKLILLVDDDKDFLKMMSGFLGERYRVAIVTSGMQAITYLAQNKPDLILLDFSMPVTSGPQVLEMIRSEPATAEIPVIFLTGQDDKDSVYEAVGMKPDGYILKSVWKMALLERIEKLFNGEGFN